MDLHILDLYRFLEKKTFFLLNLEKFLDENQAKIMEYFRQNERQHLDRSRS